MSKATYWIARHIDDPLRNEPQNIGVIVEVGGHYSGKFLGETSPGELDGRVIRSISYPNIYRQWITYWRAQFDRGIEGNELAKGKTNYRLLEGGEVIDIGNDSADDIAKYLYGRIVEKSKTGHEDPNADAPDLKGDVAKILGQHNLLKGNGSSAKYPIETKQAVKGEKTEHTIDYVQLNGSLCVMELIDFTKRRYVADHAGLTAYKFRDINDYNQGQKIDVELIAIASFREEDLHARDEIEYGFRLVKSEAGKIVNWSNESERDEFIDARLKSSGSA